MIQPLLAAALVAAQGAQAAQAPRPCVTRQEAGDMAIAFMPVLVGAVAQRCRPYLPATAFLADRSAQWVERLRRDAEPRRESALRGLSKVTAMPAPPGVGGAVAFDFLAGLVTAGFISDVTPASCADIDTLAEAVSPLPSENVARIVASTLSLAGSGEDRGAEPPAAARPPAPPRRSGPMVCPS
ncbi:MAG TPA: hypothetical protein VF704_12450 [Allosphingosinicella sp.]